MFGTNCGCNHGGMHGGMTRGNNNNCCCLLLLLLLCGNGFGGEGNGRVPAPDGANLFLRKVGEDGFAHTGAVHRGAQTDGRAHSHIQTAVGFLVQIDNIRSVRYHKMHRFTGAVLQPFQNRTADSQKVGTVRYTTGDLNDPQGQFVSSGIRIFNGISPGRKGRKQPVSRACMQLRKGCKIGQC